MQFTLPSAWYVNNIVKKKNYIHKLHNILTASYKKKKKKIF